MNRLTFLIDSRFSLSEELKVLSFVENKSLLLNKINPIYMEEKKYILFAFLLSCLNLFSQEIANSASIPVNQKSEIYNVVNDSTKQITMFVINDNENLINALQLDKNIQVTNSVSAQKPEKSYSTIIGNIVTNNTTGLFWSSNRKKILFQSFDLKNNKVTDKTFNLEFKDEVYLQDYSIGNKYMLLSIVKKSNFLKLYVFDDKGNLEIKDIDLSGVRFYHRTNLYDTFLEDFAPFERELSLSKIVSENPGMPSIAAKKRKSYITENQIIISLDTDQNYTQLIFIDLESYKATSKNFLQSPFKNFGTIEVKHNSFIDNGKLYQIKMSSKKLYLTIKDLNDNLLKEYIATKGTTIDFINSTDTKNGFPFFKNSDSFNLGLSCYNINGNTLINFTEVLAGPSTGRAVMWNFGFVGALIGELAFSGTAEKANQTQVLFDNQGNHLTDTIQPLAFEKIGIFIKENKNAEAKTLFKNADSYYFGYYNKDSKEFKINQFKD